MTTRTFCGLLCTLVVNCKGLQTGRVWPAATPKKTRQSLALHPTQNWELAAHSTALGLLFFLGGTVPCLAATPEPLFSGTVTLQEGVSLPAEAPAAALYVTAKPDRPDNVPAAILDGTRGKPPPVVSARYPNPTFPFAFDVTEENLTPEGAAAGATSDAGGDRLWWAGEDLVVSARFDTDGVAATRDPEDLVGRGILKRGRNKGGSFQSVEIKLQGRGFGGKLVTGKAK